MRLRVCVSTQTLPPRGDLAKVGGRFKGANGRPTVVFGFLSPKPLAMEGARDWLAAEASL